MTARREPLDPGLYLVATPIGSARDITLRALDVLASADILAAEDTRTLRHLMSIHGIMSGDRPVISYHDHNGPTVRPKLLAEIETGKSVAFASDAGTPGIADPGFALVREALERGLHVTSAPGASAAVAALSISGLPTDRFLFVGFAPAATGARQRFLKDFASVPATLVLYETPKRVDRLLADALEVLGPDRQVAICRELTKKFEEVRVTPLGTAAEALSDMPRKGEIVVLFDRAVASGDAASLDTALADALASGSIKDAARDVAEALGLPRREVYQRALALSRKP